jgi:hypothetical protein
MLDDRLLFPWFTPCCDADFMAYGQLVAALCGTAKAKTRVTARERETDNPKYAMRCWLLSLGMIGGEYKSARKLLLAKLDGNGAFKSGAHRKAEAA